MGRPTETCAGTPTGMQEQLLYRNVQWFQGELVFKAQRFSYHSTLGLRVIKNKKKKTNEMGGGRMEADRTYHTVEHDPFNTSHLVSRN